MGDYLIEIILMLIFMIIVFVVVVFGNFLVIFVILWNRKFCIVCNFLFFNLVVVDMF